MKKSPIISLLILGAVASLVQPALTACTNTPNLGLCKPAFGDADSHLRLNTNFDILDAPPKQVVYGPVRILQNNFIEWGPLPATTPGISFGYRSSTDRLEFDDASVSTRMILTRSGILALGTVMTTGAVGGELIVANTKQLRGVTNAGTSTIPMIRVHTADQIEIAPDGHDIRWGRALVALGGGATPTFGTIGGSGPGTAAQNSWMRVIDPGGAAFWVAVWK